MSLNCGIVGLPNVGKSTLFNALTKTMLAEIANYPFCTIEPNVGKVSLEDSRLKMLAEITGSQKIIYNQLEFVDIAGLIRGASSGEGLGNKFLSHIREVDAIIHVLRCFEDSNITHVSSKIDPVDDAEIVEMELILSDIDSIKRRLPSIEKSVRSNDKSSKDTMAILLNILSVLEEGKPARSMFFENYNQIKQLNLITTKPVMYVCNVGEHDVDSGNIFSKLVQSKLENSNTRICCISAKLEEEVSGFDSEKERKDFLWEFGLLESGLVTVGKNVYDLLNMITFFTVGEKEARAWSIPKFTSAYKAAGVIHTDFQKKFIKSETISFDDYIKYGGELGCREAGKIRFEGREYLVQDGDIMHFRFNR